MIDFLRRPEDSNTPLTEFISLYPKRKLAISVLTVQELYSGKSSREFTKEQPFLKLIGKTELLPYIYETAKLAGCLVRDSDKSFGFPDAQIAATAILNKASLLTLNKKDFKGIKGLKLI